MRLDLSLSKFDEMLKKSAMDFMRRGAPKLVVEELLETDTGFDGAMWEKMVEMGWMGIIIPEAYGGIGSSLTSAGILFEVLGTGPLPGPYFSSGILGSLILLEAGNEEQKKNILPEIVRGKAITTLAYTEPEFSWEPQTLNTVAESRSSDFILNGKKLFVYDAGAASQFIVAARTEKDKPLPAIHVAFSGGQQCPRRVDPKTFGLFIREGL